MKITLLVLLISPFMLGLISTSCNTPGEKIEKAIVKVNDANMNLEKANAEFDADIANYRKQEAAKIVANEQSIADFKVRIATQKKDAQTKYLKDIAELEQKNSDMKKQLDMYKAEGKENWATFKTKFSNDMDELGKAFKNFVTPTK